MATLPAATALTRAGVLISGALATSASVADKFANTGKQFLAIRNGSGGGINCTLVTTPVITDTGGTLTIQDPVVAIAAGETRIMGPFRPSVYNDSQGYVNYTLDSASSVTAQVFSATAEPASA